MQRYLVAGLILGLPLIPLTWKGSSPSKATAKATPNYSAFELRVEGRIPSPHPTEGLALLSFPEVPYGRSFPLAELKDDGTFQQTVKFQATKKPTFMTLAISTDGKEVIKERFPLSGSATLQLGEIRVKP